MGNDNRKPYMQPFACFSSSSRAGGAPDISVEAFAREGEDNFDWQFLSGALVLLGAAGRCQQCFAILEKVTCGRRAEVAWNRIQEHLP